MQTRPPSPGEHVTVEPGITQQSIATVQRAPFGRQHVPIAPPVLSHVAGAQHVVSQDWPGGRQLASPPASPPAPASLASPPASVGPPLLELSDESVFEQANSADDEATASTSAKRRTTSAYQNVKTLLLATE